MNPKLRFLCLFVGVIFLLSGCFLFPPAPTGTVSGYVVNRKAGTAVEGVTVSVEGLSGTATTDQNGFYSIDAPSGTNKVSLTFSKDGHAQAKVYGISVQEDETTSYSTIVAPVFDPALPAEAPGLEISVSDGDSFSGEGEDDSFVVTMSGTTSEPDKNGFFFADIGLGSVGGSSGFLNGAVSHVRLFSWTGVETEVSLTATGFSGATTLHFLAYDQNNNRVEIIRDVTITSSLSGAAPKAPTNVSGLAVTFGDTAVFGPLGADLALNARDIVNALESNDYSTLKDDLLDIKNNGLNKQGFLDEVVMWVDVNFSYEFNAEGDLSDLPEAFELQRKFAGEEDFTTISRVQPLISYAGTEAAPTAFTLRDATAALRADVETTYRVEAVTGSQRQSSEETVVKPLKPFYVNADSPANGALDVSVEPAYQMSFENRNSLLWVGAIVLDRVQAETLLEWAFGPVIVNDPDLTSVSIPHNVDGTAATLKLQAYHTYDWQPIAATSDGELTEDGLIGLSAISVAADFFDILGVGFGVSDGPVHVFTTGDGSE